jgi:hypothetical protein
MRQKTWALALTVGLLGAGGASQAALVDAGNGLVNDTVLDITWVANAGLSNEQLSGAANWQDLVDWADALVYGGYDDWRLASMSSTSPTNTVFDCSTGTEQQCIESGNQLGYMFHYNIAGGFPKTGDQTVGDVTLTGIQNAYWSGTEFASVRTSRGSSAPSMASITTTLRTSSATVGRFAPDKSPTPRYLARPC